MYVLETSVEQEDVLLFSLSLVFLPLFVELGFLESTCLAVISLDMNVVLLFAFGDFSLLTSRRACPRACLSGGWGVNGG